jgi:hypothetical protein
MSPLQHKAGFSLCCFPVFLPNKPVRKIVKVKDHQITNPNQRQVVLGCPKLDRPPV